MTCPHCGRCSHCGHQVRPAPYVQPAMPYPYPYTTPFQPTTIPTSQPIWISRGNQTIC